MGLRWPVPSMRPRPPLRLPFDSGFPTHSKPLGHDFSNQKMVRNLSTVLCCDMEHGAQMSATLCCLLQQKPKEVSRRSVQFPLKKADTSKPLHPNFWLFSQQPTTDKKAGNGMVLFPSVLGCDMERGAQICVHVRLARQTRTQQGSWSHCIFFCMPLPLLACCDNATKVDDKAHLLKLFHLSLHACGSSTTWGR